MFNTSIIEVAVGLFFIFALMALLVTQTNTIITNTLNLRAKQLKSGLMTLITDERIQAKLLAHPLINMVEENITGELTPEKIKEIINSPPTNLTYISPETFTETIINLLIEEAQAQLFEAIHNAINTLGHGVEKSELRECLNTLRNTFSEENLRHIYALVYKLEDGDVKTALQTSLQTLENVFNSIEARSEEVIPLLQGAKNIADSQLRAALESILRTAENLNDARKKIEHWFNDGMGRVTSIFKKNLMWWSLTVAFIYCLVLNVDTLAIGQALWEDPQLRASVAEAARNYNADPITNPDLEIEIDPNLPPEETTLEDISMSVQQAQQTAQELVSLQLPLGWQYTPVTDEMVQQSLTFGFPDPRSNPRNFWNFIPGNSPNWFVLILGKLIGLTATTIAAAQGAPFWFDLLKKLTSPSK
ncbi:MAG: hypothetical protein CUN56_02970 [Phototrophicales bacterium]|nr:MAG: hypothetical protein CUN56_02970 [Phototrophicales bacterium]